MNVLIIARHGDYEDSNPELFSDKLTAIGREQMTLLAESIKNRVGGASALMLSSSARRATESAEVIDQALKIGFKDDTCLWLERNTPQAILAIEAIEDQAEVLIVVTHLPSAIILLKHSLEKYKIDNLCRSLGKGRAWMINFKEKTITYLP